MSPRRAVLATSVAAGALPRSCGVRLRESDASLVESATDSPTMSPTMSCFGPGGRIFGNYVCPAANESHVEICDGVTEIPEGAFYECRALEVVTIPQSVTSIGNSAFVCCTAMRGITIPDSVTSVGMHAFKGCDALESIHMPDSITSVGFAAFTDCKALLSADISANLEILSLGLFAYCPMLTQVTIPRNSVREIQTDAFLNCSALPQVTIPNSVTTIGSGVFMNCASLAQVTISSSVTEIMKDTFKNCLTLPNVIIPNSVTVIRQYAFNNCAALAQVAMSTAIEGIGPNAFTSTSLTFIYIPRFQHEVLLPPKQALSPVYPFDPACVVAWRTTAPTPLPTPGPTPSPTINPTPEPTRTMSPTPEPTRAGLTSTTAGPGWDTGGSSSGSLGAPGESMGVLTGEPTPSPTAAPTATQVQGDAGGSRPTTTRMQGDVGEFTPTTLPGQPAPVPTPAPGPTPKPAPTLTQGKGDPHITNAAGDSFDVNQPGNYTMVRVPMEGPPALELSAVIKVVGNACSLFITEATLRGDLLGGKAVSFRAMRHNAFQSQHEDDTPFGIQLEADGPWLGLEDLASGGEEIRLSEIQRGPVNLVIKAQRQQAQTVEGFFAIVVTMPYLPEPNNHALIKVSKQRRWLNVKVIRLGVLGYPSIGGLLGTQKPEAAWLETSQACRIFRHNHHLNTRGDAAVSLLQDEQNDGEEDCWKAEASV